jgi:hypothetical protein
MFNRGHVHRCLYPQFCPVFVDAESLEEGWQQDAEMLLEDAEQNDWSYHGHYTILDFYLNEGLFAHFASFAIVIDRLLSGCHGHAS